MVGSPPINWMCRTPQSVAYARMDRHRALRRPEESWLTAMAEATEAWANYRGMIVR